MHGFAPREIPLLAAKRRGIVLETSTVIGLIMGLISIFVGMVIKGAPLSALNNPAAFLIIICGTISCLFTGFPMENMKNIPNLFKKVINRPQLKDRGELLKMFVELSQIARREGILALESKVQEIEDPMEKKMRQLDKLVDELAKGKPMEKVLR